MASSPAAQAVRHAYGVVLFALLAATAPTIVHNHRVYIVGGTAYQSSATLASVEYIDLQPYPRTSSVTSQTALWSLSEGRQLMRSAVLNGTGGGLACMQVQLATVALPQYLTGLLVAQVEFT